jgi:ubiquinone/menaquinone biosynthesis C-methylase UbiE
VEQSDAISLPYADRSFDVVISMLVWHHVEAWDKALAEAARCFGLRAGCCSSISSIHSPVEPSGASPSMCSRVDDVCLWVGR